MSQSGVPVPCDQAAVWIQQAALPGHRQERQQAADDVGAGQSVVGAKEVEGGAGMGAPAGAPHGLKAVNAV